MALFRRRPPVDPFPEDWEDVVAARVAGWWDRSLEHRTRRRDLMEPLLVEKRWEAARGFELTDEVRLVIAAEAAQLGMGLGPGAFAKVRTIVVHATARIDHEPQPGPVEGVWDDEPVELLGEADHATGPVTLAWDEVCRNARHPRRGLHVVLHEFAHKVDMLDGTVDGTPPLPTRADRERWIEVCTAHYEAIRAGGGCELLDDYAGEDPGEFFAVATEAFFCLPQDLRAEAPDLYEVLATAYRHDPTSALSDSPE